MGILVNTQDHAKIIRDQIMKLHLAAGWVASETSRININHIELVNGSSIHILNNLSQCKGRTFSAFAMWNELKNFRDAYLCVAPCISNQSLIVRFN